MRCVRARRWISDALDGALPSRRGDRLGAHLRACGTCRAYRDRILRIQEGARLPSEPGPEFWTVFERRLAAEIGSAGEEGRRGGAVAIGVRRRWAWAAAAALILAGLGIWYALQRPEPALTDAWVPYGDIIDPLAAVAGPELEAFVDREIRALVEDAAPAAGAEAAVLPAEDPLFWESLDDEDLRAVITALENESGRGGPQ